MSSAPSVFRVLLLDETKGKRWIRELTAIAVIMGIILFIIPSSYTALGVQSFGHLLKGTIAAGLYLSVLSAISKARDPKYKLLLSMPMDKRRFVFLYAFVLWVKNYGLRMMPVVMSVLAVSVNDGKLTLLQLVLTGAGCAVSGLAASLCGTGAVIFAYERGLLRFRAGRSTMKFNWFKREFVRFASDKVLLLNHLGYSLFMIFFLFNAIAVSHVDSRFILFLLTLLSTASTPGVLFSYEKPYRSLLLSLPVSGKTLFVNKYLFSIAITLPLYLLAYAIVHIYQPAIGTPGLLVLMLCSLGLTVFIKLYYDFKRPNFEWSHTRQMFEHKRKYKLWTMSIAVSAPWMLYSYVAILGIIAAQWVVTWCFLYAIRRGGAAVNRF